MQLSEPGEWRIAEIGVKPTMGSSNYGLNLSRYVGAVASLSYGMIMLGTCLHLFSDCQNYVYSVKL